MPAPRIRGIGHLPWTRDEYWQQCSEYLGFPVLTKQEVYASLKYKPLHNLIPVHQCRETHRIVGGGNRSGKSQLATWEIIPYLFYQTRGWIVSANYDLAEIIIEKICDILVERGHLTRVKRADNLQPLEFCYEAREHCLTVWTGAKLEAKSAENADSMHGHDLDYVVIDEAALLPFPLYDTRIVPRLIDSGGWLMAIGTFETFEGKGEWFENYFELGKVENDQHVRSWTHRTADNYHKYVARGGETRAQVADDYSVRVTKLDRDNPNVSWPLKPGDEVFVYNVDLTWLEEEKKRISPEVYKARYEAQPAPSQYLVFPDWDITKHAGAEARRRCAFDPDLPVYIAVDPGGTYAVAVIQLKRFEDAHYDNAIAKGYHVCIIDELYFQTTVTTAEVFREMKKRDWFPNLAREVDYWDKFQGSIDVMAKEQWKMFRSLGHDDDTLGHLNLHRHKVLQADGIRTMQHYLDTHTLWSHPNNRWMHTEFARYHWQNPSLNKVETADPRKGRAPVDEWNHLVKAVWYFLVAKFGYYGRSQKPAVATLDALLGRKQEG